MKTNQKSVRLSDRAVKHIENYRGQSFCDKLENFVLDTSDRQEQLVEQWNRTNAEIERKKAELRRLHEQIKDYENLHWKLRPLLDALDKLVPKV